MKTQIDYKGKYEYRYTMTYLPTRYSASEEEWENRHAVWDFKDGKDTDETTMIIGQLRNEVNTMVRGNNKSDYIVCFIPASTSEKTFNRYQGVAEYISRFAGVKATLSAITRSCDSTAGHVAGKSLDPTKNFVFNSDLIQGKKVILIDDVITRGRTFKDTADKLMANGATSVTGLFVAKTINPDFYHYDVPVSTGLRRRATAPNPFL